jgi:hypothetical protein
MYIHWRFVMDGNEFVDADSGVREPQADVGYLLVATGREAMCLGVCWLWIDVSHGDENAAG